MSVLNKNKSILMDPYSNLFLYASALATTDPVNNTIRNTTQVALEILEDRNLDPKGHDIFEGPFSKARRNRNNAFEATIVYVEALASPTIVTYEMTAIDNRRLVLA
ncbi:TPA: hypothetical protein DDW69_02070 [candidate division CPR2 bacterium]|uniref:Uncharacterized protein n=1 Tax=candidate division CPR2 bacterium GW2011_GWC1_41_48 TaxID=1618344 RepID=A0A0G0WCM8_UNCC2|nr:MAG: hypothetical protein UT47_C0001G0217 [candidate division CPR2 bacterium GW2011_GWC2_39_35]KKR28100.1 MAG: hypothetical protein UT59_C0035G0010 [candidate division CPR2 bacterium GW2011_GWD1_39_7]KKR28130.1 MAG: hypothetical protein UT60_C0027G0020 [candidate division CPR2 bacterium GW2011_GWD2_39_7]KKS09812.1 MAG: hypothetical protein UU65_C0001G0217 [candidate division CPR2 bacterium GW2011_GWC1_41_48]OGB60296.1 MAG: hypothetical protein A2Y27_01505 [candidate division CPR2 bacterium G